MEQISTSSSCGLTRGYNNKKTGVDLWRLGTISIKILEIIRDCNGATGIELGKKLNRKTNYINEYLHRLQKYGFVYRNNDNWKWYLLEPYADFQKDLDTILYVIYNDNTTTTQQQHNNNTNGNVLSLNNNNKNKIEKKKVSVQLTLKPYNNPDYNETENKIVNLLLYHHSQTGSKFIYFKDIPELCERVECPPDVLEAALCKLRQDSACYLWRDKEYNRYQLRIKPAFLERQKYR